MTETHTGYLSPESLEIGIFRLEFMIHFVAFLLYLYGRDKRSRGVRRTDYNGNCN